MDIEQSHHPIAEARANLSELLNSVRLLRRVYFLTSRGKSQAAVVPAELGEAIVEAGGADAVLKLLRAGVRSESAGRSQTTKRD